MKHEVTDTVLLDVNIDSFEYVKGVPVLKNIHQKVRDIVRPGMAQGQVVAILGPSGIGKSTMFELIAGLRTPTKGSVQTFDPAKQALVPVRTGLVGMVYQSYELFPFMTVRALLELGASKGELKAAEAKEKVDFYLEHFRLREHARKYPNQLSGGQRQRLAIAQQLLCSNMLLLMDEPFSGLDPVIKASICELISDVAQLDELMTILIVSHDIEPTLSIADTVWLLGKTEDGSATVVENINLLERGLCWRKDIREDPEFRDLVFNVTKRFAELSGKN
jgi:polar amino acid transport system ATP-binding protein/sulfate transport system ATP-binding protein